MGRYPRTVAEFEANQRFVLVKCEACRRERQVPPDVLDAAFGPDFDLYAGFAGLEAELRCDQCGQKHRVIEFYNANERTFFGEVSFEDFLNRELERRAFIAIRDRGKPEPVKAVRRRQRS